MSDVDISTAVIMRYLSDWLAGEMPNSKFAHWSHAVVATLRHELTATQEKLAAAESQIEADNSRLRYALRDERSRFGLSPSYEDVCSAIGQIEMAMKSLPPAPVRDDAWALRLINAAATAARKAVEIDDVHGLYYGSIDAEAILAAFNTQEKP